mmetsp:Transcript_8492/g.21039  ORF Transcript_8492/g.21039 Transcript_8492/m.21039 type:complete len:203 (+) Transcript_8492:45-653(+)
MKKARATFLLVGLDNSGKTTLARAVKYGYEAGKNGKGRAPVRGFGRGDGDSEGEGEAKRHLDVEPTIGFKVEKVEVSKRLKLNIVDMSGQQCYRELWETYYEDVQGILFVVDAADPKRFEEAKAALESVVGHRELLSKPLLLFSNKMDLAGAPTSAEVAKEVGLGDLAHHLSRAWRLQGCSAITGEGVDDGLKWMISQVKAS